VSIYEKKKKCFFHNWKIITQNNCVHAFLCPRAIKKQCEPDTWYDLQTHVLDREPYTILFIDVVIIH
jgi:hypothetical protein